MAWRSTTRQVRRYIRTRMRLLQLWILHYKDSTIVSSPTSKQTQQHIIFTSFSTNTKTFDIKETSQWVQSSAVLRACSRPLALASWPLSTVLLLFSKASSEPSPHSSIFSSHALLAGAVVDDDMEEEREPVMSNVTWSLCSTTSRIFKFTGSMRRLEKGGYIDFRRNVRWRRARLGLGSDGTAYFSLQYPALATSRLLILSYW